MFSSILVPLDGSTLAAEALGPVGELARRLEAPVTLLTVLNPEVEDYFSGFTQTKDIDVPEAVRTYLEGRARVLQAAGVATETQVVTGPVAIAETIVAFAREWGIDLIVMSTHGRSGMARILLGSVTDQVVRTSPLPVLVLRPARGGVTQGFGVPEHGRPPG